MDHLTRLLVEAKDGDHRALERFILETQPAVWRMCTHLGDRDTAEDLTQESYERAIASLHRFRAEGSALHWLLTIARRTCADSTRTRSRRRRLTAATIAEAPRSERAGSAEEDLIELQDLLARLDPDRRAAFVVTQILGLRYEEAATICDCPVGTIRSRVARARIDLMEMMRPESLPDSPTRRSLP